MSSRLTLRNQSFAQMTAVFERRPGDAGTVRLHGTGTQLLPALRLLAALEQEGGQS